MIFNGIAAEVSGMIMAPSLFHFHFFFLNKCLKATLSVSIICFIWYSIPKCSGFFLLVRVDQYLLYFVSIYTKQLNAIQFSKARFSGPWKTNSILINRLAHKCLRIVAIWFWSCRFAKYLSLLIDTVGYIRFCYHWRTGKFILIKLLIFTIFSMLVNDHT